MIRAEANSVVWRMTPDDAERLASELPPSWSDCIGDLFAAVDEINDPVDLGGRVRIVLLMDEETR